MVVFDSTIMLLLLFPSARPPIDPNTGKPLELAKERIEQLVKTISKERSRVVIPTPVLSEILVKTGGATSKYLDEINSQNVFLIGDFDVRAAVEVAAISDKQNASGQKKHDAESTWAKIKYDRQIVAIAKVYGVTKIYSDDEGMFSAGKLVDVDVVRSWELPLSNESRQGKLELPEKESKDDDANE